MKKALLTGITGFIGLNLGKALVQDGWDVYGIVRESSKLEKVKQELGDKATLFIHGKEQDLNAIVAKVKPDVVFHLASVFLSSHTYKDIALLITSNITFGTELLEAMATNGAKNFVNTGTSWQHFNNENYNPVNLYAASKQAFLDIVRYYQEAKAFNVIDLELFDTYGPGDPRRKLFALLKEISESHEILKMSKGEQLIDIVYIEDVVRAFVLAGNYLVNGEYDKCGTYAVSSGKAIPLKELVAKFAQISGREINVEWGERPYRDREVMKPWDAGEILPGWQCDYPLEVGVELFIKEKKVD